MLIPRSMRKEILTEHHNSRMVAHLGRERTIAKLKQSPYFWIKMRKDAEDWCRNCDICARIKPNQRVRRAPMKNYQVGVPLERVAIDILGPLPVTERGNKYIVVIADYFTRWVESYPVPNHQAHTIANVIMENFFARFGLPRTIHTDQGRDFESRLFQNMCHLLGIDKTRTTPWHPQSDGLIERYNRTLETMLKEMVSEQQTDWDLYVGLCCMAYRATPHEATKMTPNLMMLGRNLPMPSHLQLKSPEVPPENLPDYVAKLEERILKAHDHARRNNSRAQIWAKHEYDKSAKIRNLCIGDWVWIFNPSKKGGRSPKLQLGWERRPYKILEILNDVVLRTQQYGNGKKRVVHTNCVQPVRDPEQVLRELDEGIELQRPLVQIDGRQLLRRDRSTQ